MGKRKNAKKVGVLGGKIRKSLFCMYKCGLQWFKYTFPLGIGDMWKIILVGRDK